MRPIRPSLRVHRAGRRWVGSLLVPSILAVSGSAQASPVAWTIDAERSSVRLSATLAENSLEMGPQGAGSLQTRVGGYVTTEINIDAGAPTILFFSGGEVRLEESGLWAPHPAGVAGASAANFAGSFDLGDAGRIDAAIRGFEARTVSIPLVVYSDGSRFRFLSDVIFLPRFDLDFAGSGPIASDLPAGSIAFDGTRQFGGAISFGSIDLGPEAITLTLPVDLRRRVEISSSLSVDLRLSGSIVAVAVPEAGPLSLALVAAICSSLALAMPRSNAGRPSAWAQVGEG